MEYIFRPLSYHDATMLHHNCWPHVSLDQVRQRVKHFLNRYDRQEGWGLIAEQAYDVIAFGQIVRWGGVYEICDLVVAENRRDQGVGTRLIYKLLDVAREHGIQRVEIGAALSNTRALALYRRLGFRDYKKVVMNLEGEAQPVLYLMKYVQEIRLV